MPVGGKSHHVVLHRATVNASVPLRTGLMLLPDENGALSYRWELARPLAPDVSFEQVSYAEQPPDQELVWSQRDWSGGALSLYNRRAAADRYATMHGLWPLVSGELTVGTVALPIPFGLLNGHPQADSTANWTASGVTLTSEDTAPFAGRNHFQMASTSTGDYISNTSLENVSTLWAGNPIQVWAYVRGSAAGGAMRVQIIESGGVSTPTTSGTAVTLTTAYQLITASVTLQADTTGVEVRIECSADEGADRIVYVGIVNIVTGSTAALAVRACRRGCRMVARSPAGSFAAGGRIYMATHSALWRLSWGAPFTLSSYWTLIRRFANEIVGLELYQDRLYVGLNGANYQYSDAGSETTWSTSTVNGAFFAQTLNVNSQWALARAILGTENNISLSTDPVTPTWGSNIEAGGDDHEITNIHPTAGGILVAKNDGLYEYRQLDGNRFVPVLPEASLTMGGGINNLRLGINYHGKWYGVLALGSLLSYDGEDTDLIKALRAPGFAEWGPHLYALGTDGEFLYALVSDNSTQAIASKAWLVALEKAEGGHWQVHTLAQCPAYTTDALSPMFHAIAESQDERFLIATTEINAAYVAGYAFILPYRGFSLRDSEGLVLSTPPAAYITEYWDGNRPQVQKSANRLTLLSQGLQAGATGRRVTVAYQVDDETTWTDINSSDATFNTSPSETISFNANVTFRRIRLRFTVYGFGQSNGRIDGFILEISWRPTRLKRWWMVASLDGTERNLQGVQAGIPAAKLISQLDTLNDQVAPLDFEDLDNTAQRVNIVEMRELQYRTRPNPTGELQYARAVEIVLQEVQT